MPTSIPEKRKRRWSKPSDWKLVSADNVDTQEKRFVESNIHWMASMARTMEHLGYKQKTIENYMEQAIHLILTLREDSTVDLSKTNKRIRELYDLLDIVVRFHALHFGVTTTNTFWGIPYRTQTHLPNIQIHFVTDQSPHVTLIWMMKKDVGILGMHLHLDKGMSIEEMENRLIPIFGCK